MESITVNVSINNNGSLISVKGRKMRFSPYRLFTYNDSNEEIKCLKLLGDYLISKDENIAVYGSGRFFAYFLKHVPGLKSSIRCIIEDDSSLHKSQIEGITVVSPENLPHGVKTVFLCETLTVPRQRMKKNLGNNISIISADILIDISRDSIPARAWIPERSAIYPIDIPEISFQHGLDMILLDTPSRNMAFMPNGLAYVNNALKKAGVKFQTVDLDIITYHRYHTHRLLDGPETILTPAGNQLPDDPWLAENYDLWQRQDTIEFFRPEIEEVVQALAKAMPKIIGFSVQACNIKFAKEVAMRIKSLLPDTIILSGGYSCYQPAVGLLAFPEADYMIIGEADLNVGSLVKRLAAGERPTGLPGIMSKYDLPGQPFKHGPMPDNLDALDMPKYEWYGIDIYRNYNHYQLTPIIASRGCRWSRCKFCAERFAWRIRSPENVVDEFEYLASQGCDLFMFNESDLNGMPEALLKICDEIIRRRLAIKLTGQLRIHKNSDRGFFDKLKAAGFVSLRFGVDAWSQNTLRLQTKGYTLDMISQNLKDCHKSGIYTEVNIVLGVPGETDDDITESINLIAENKPYIGRVANINPLMLMSGSIYWEEPAKYNIQFRGDKKEILRQHQHMVPDNLWYSENPYIDEKIRRKRFERVVMELHKLGFDVGPFAKQVIKDVFEGKGAGRSARPDASCSDDALLKITDKMKPQIVNLESSGSVPTNNKKDLQIIKYGDDFYGIDHESCLGIKGVLADSNIVKVLRENPGSIRLITEGFYKYNIIKVEGSFFGIKQGYGFDINLAESGEYEHGVCIKGRSIKDVEGKISKFVSI